MIFFLHAKRNSGSGESKTTHAKSYGWSLMMQLFV